MPLWGWIVALMVVGWIGYAMGRWSRRYDVRRDPRLYDTYFSDLRRRMELEGSIAELLRRAHIMRDQHSEQRAQRRLADDPPRDSPHPPTT